MGCVLCLIGLWFRVFILFYIHGYCYLLRSAVVQQFTNRERTYCERPPILDCFYQCYRIRFRAWICTPSWGFPHFTWWAQFRCVFALLKVYFLDNAQFFFAYYWFVQYFWLIILERQFENGGKVNKEWESWKYDRFWAVRCPCFFFLFDCWYKHLPNSINIEPFRSRRIFYSVNLSATFF